MADPSTIQFNTATAQGGTLGARAAVPTVGVQGGGIGTANPVRPAASFFDAAGGMTADLGGNLPKFLDDAFAPALEATKKKREWEGFTAARAGQQMDEIQKSQPWYTQIFGPTNYEIGAATYTAMKHVSDMENDILQRMPELRQKSPAEMARVFNEASEQARTGNSYTDAIIAKTFMERAGPLMDLHTKERVAWQQTQAIRAQFDAADANASSFQTLARSNATLGGSAPEQPEQAELLTQASASYLETLQPSRFQTDASYKAFFKSHFRSLVDKGNYYAVQLLDKNGVLSYLDPDEELELRSYLKTHAGGVGRQDYLDANPEVNLDIAMIGVLANNTAIGGKKALELIEKVNAKHMVDTGSPVPLLDSRQIAQYFGQAVGEHIQMQEAALRERAAAAKAEASEAAKAEARAEDIKGYADAFNNGSLGQQMSLPGADKQLAQATGYQTFMASMEKNPSLALGRLVWNFANGSAVLDKYKEDLDATGRNVLLPDPSDAAQAYYSRWKAMVSAKANHINERGEVEEGKLTGMATAATYYPKDIHGKLLQLDQLISPQLPFSIAYKLVFGKEALNAPTTLPAVSREEAQKRESRVASVVKSLSPSVTVPLFGEFGTKLSPSSREAAAKSIVAAQQSTVGLFGTDKDSLLAAGQLAKTTRGAEAAGEYFWENLTDNEGNVKRSIGSWLGFENPSVTAPAIENAINAGLRKAKIEPGSLSKYEIFRRADEADGTPSLLIYGIGPGGMTAPVVIGGSEIRDEFNKWREWKKQQRLPPGATQTRPSGSRGIMY